MHAVHSHSENVQDVSENVIINVKMVFFIAALLPIDILKIVFYSMNCTGDRNKAFCWVKKFVVCVV